MRLALVKDSFLGAADVHATFTNERIMSKRETGRYESTSAAGEQVRAFVPHTLPPAGPPVVSEGELAERARAAEQALVRLELAGETSADFTLLTAEPPGPLAPGATFDVEVEYSPSDDDPDTGTLVVTCDDPDTPEVSVPLSGGLLPQPDIELSPADLDFGSMDVGQTAALSTVVHNLGQLDLHLGPLSIIRQTLEVHACNLNPNMHICQEVFRAPKVQVLAPRYTAHAALTPKPGVCLVTGMDNPTHAK